MSLVLRPQLIWQEVFKEKKTKEKTQTKKCWQKKLVKKKSRFLNVYIKLLKD